MVMTDFFQKLYKYFETLPDRCYPFGCEIEGRFVRGRQAYERALAQALDTYGFGRLGYKLILYRSTFHLIGAIIFVSFAAFLSHRLFGSDIALYVVCGAAIAALTFQEFYVHPKLYGQVMTKGVVDWMSWVTPMAAYIVFFIS